MQITIKDIKADCRYFKGDVPCKPSKDFGVICKGCSHYSRFKENILIIKLGAAGDVIRTTPLLYPIKKEYPDSRVFWLTYSPELVPGNINETPNADVILQFNLQNILYIQQIEFDVLINLDKDREAISLANVIKSKKKTGYTIKNGNCSPISEKSEHKFLTGIFDDISKNNTKNYLEEIFEICGYTFNKEKYILPRFELTNKIWDIDKNKRIIGLNTGCGSRWTSRLWKNDYWIKLSKDLINKGYEVILLGGEQEDKNNKLLSKESGAKYLGYYDLNTFIDLVDQCDLVVTQVTMAMHITIGLSKKIVLLNNIFNRNEFELYGNGVIIEPEKKCECYFSPKCKNKEYKCMDYLHPENVFASAVNLLRNT